MYNGKKSVNQLGRDNRMKNKMETYNLANIINPSAISE